MDSEEVMELVSDLLKVIIHEKECNIEYSDMCGGYNPWSRKMDELEIEEIKKLKKAFDKEAFGKVDNNKNTEGFRQQKMAVREMNEQDSMK